MNRVVTTLAVRILLAQTIGLAALAAAGLTVLYVGIHSIVYDDIRKSGVACADMLGSMIEEEPSLMSPPMPTMAGHAMGLDHAIDSLREEFDSVTRISVVDHRLLVVADSSDVPVGVPTDQSALIGVIQSPPGQVVPPLLYTRHGQRYLRIAQTLYGPESPGGAPMVLGAVSIDVDLSKGEARVQQVFGRAALTVGLLFIVQIGSQILFLRRTVLAPIRALVAAIRALQGGQLTARAPIDGTGELGELGTAFNTMAGEIQRTNSALQDQKQSLHTIIHTSPLAIIELDANRLVKRWNPAAEQIFGWSEAEALGHPLRTVPPDQQADADALFDALLQGNSVTGVDATRVRKNGTRVEVAISAVPLRDPAGAVTGFSAIVADVSRLKQAEDMIQASNITLVRTVARLERHSQELRLLGEMADLLQACGRLDEAYLVINRCLEKLFPTRCGTLYEIPPSRDQLEPVARWGASTTMVRLFAMDGCWALRRGRPYLVDDCGTSLLCAHVSDELAEPVPYLCVPMMAQGEAIGLLHFRVTPDDPSRLGDSQPLIETVSEQMALALSNLRLRDALRRQSIRDTLTDLFNRRYLDETLPREIARAKRGNLPLSVIMMDVDHFKRFNDTYGHEAGDMVLKTVGKFLKSKVRTEDIACRYGGEEFTLILPGAAREIAQDRAERLRQGIRSLVLNHNGHPVGPLTLSLGVAIFPANGEDGPAVLQAADTALYRAKQSGRDQVALAA